MTMPPSPDAPTGGVVFRGNSRADVKRRAVRWWSRHAASTMPLQRFLASCRMDSAERVIVFTPTA